MRRTDITLDHRGAAWLTTVATREGWRLASTAREVPMGSIRAEIPERCELPEPASAALPPHEQALARVAHAERVGDLRTLKARERRDLYPHALGYRYNEIAQATGSSYTAVDRRLKEGRAQLRRLARERREPYNG